MAVPSSGSLSLFGIYKELTTNTYTTTYDGANNISIRLASIGTYGTININNAAADRPNGSPPHAMSEFYNYDHDIVTLTSFSSSINSNFFGVCSEPITATYYHDGSFTYPDVGDTVYSNSSGSSYLSSGYYKLGSGDFMNVGSSGSVISVDPCGP